VVDRLGRAVLLGWHEGERQRYRGSDAHDDDGTGAEHADRRPAGIPRSRSEQRNQRGRSRNGEHLRGRSRTDLPEEQERRRDAGRRCSKSSAQLVSILTAEPRQQQPAERAG